MRNNSCWVKSICCLLLATSTVARAENATLLGFVSRHDQGKAFLQACLQRDNCFILEIEQAGKGFKSGQFIAISVDKDTIYLDPENYQLTTQQADIKPGNHLWVLMQYRPDSPAEGGKASVVLIGD